MPIFNDVTWLNLSPDKGTTPSTLDVSVVNPPQAAIRNNSEVAAAVFNASITITADSTGRSITVPVKWTTLTPTGAALATSPQSLEFNMQQGGTNPPTKALAVTSTGGALNWNAQADVPWLALVPQSGSTPSSINVSVVQTSGLTAGVQNGNIILNASGASNSPLKVPVKLTVTPGPTSPLQFTAPNPLPQATVGERYEFNFCQGARKNEPCGGSLNPATSPTGGNPPYHFQLDSGVGFPPFGLVLDVNGLLSGTPTAAGTSTFRVCAVDLSGTQACQTTSLTVNNPPSGSALDGNWSGTFRATSPSLCVGSGTWEARNVRVVNGIVSGSWRTGADPFEPLNGTFDGRTTKLFAGSGTERIDLTGTVTGTSISGDFAGPECTPFSGLIKGAFMGNKTSSASASPTGQIVSWSAASFGSGAALFFLILPLALLVISIVKRISTLTRGAGHRGL